MLGNVVILRLLLIVLLVLYHSFCIFCGAWTIHDDYPHIPLYWWIAKSAYSFMLEAFVFISGFLYGYQVKNKGLHIISIKNTVYRKFKRLLLPCFFFGIAYYLMFYDLNRPFYEITYMILNGTGHLWFLPMLFWCFVLVYIIQKIKLHQNVALVLCVIAVICSFLPLPFRLGNTMYYFIFFYTGYCINVYSWDIERYFCRKRVIQLGCLWMSIFILSITFNETPYIMGWGGNTLLISALRIITNKLLMLCYSFFGLAMIFCLINLILKKKRFQITSWMIKISTLCFWVYIYQQFILKVIYYQLNWVDLISPVILPWIGLIVTIILSLLFSHYTLKTRLGRFLIG